jgi:signal transduction histidine kinase
MLEQERSAREELEGAYEEVQRLLSQEERAAVILRGWAHAVKSPLTIIRRELESTQGPAPADLSERVRAIVDTVDRMLGAAVDLQSRMIELRSELNLLLYRTAQRFAKVEIHASQGEDIHIHADHAKLMMAFENLFLNACQTVDEAGGNVWLEVTRHGERVIVRVRDDGGGIPERIRSRLFEHTVTTRKDRGGTGLGLLITRHVIEAHNGSVTVENTGPTGTAFRVEIPRRWKT